ncbi:MAG: leucine-rich repeat domain-containing protein [Clostridia bacterium]|nr:leucine-rich repeat domain-containing protein [Clostridia bacterium]
MKKKILFALAIVAMLVCIFAVSVGAEAPEMYIEFGARFPGSDEYITVYTQNAESVSHPHINFATYKFYSDVEFTQEVDMSTVTGIDFSVAKTHGCNGNAPNRMTKPSAPFVNCEEVKWFLEGFPTVSYSGGLFKGWTGLKHFDFGNATAINDNTFENAGFESITIPATIKIVKNSSFKDCASLKSVKFEGALDSLGISAFSGCTALTSVDLGQITVIGESMFKGCSSLTSIDIPSTVTEIKSSAFHSCSALSSVTMQEGITKMGNYAFYKIGGASLHIPATVQSLGYQLAEESGIVSLTFAQGSRLTFIDHRAFMNCKSLEGTVILPDGLIEIDYGLFSGCAKLKAVKIPDSVTKYTENKAMFTGCSSLEFVQLSKNVSVIPSSMFENCTSLKAISIPEGVTTMNYKALRNCTSLEAVYLPSTLTNLGVVSSSATDWGVFYQSPKVFFVNEPFEVFDGNELIDDKLEMPEKPEVYYMPSGLVSVANSEFQNCNNLNNVIVFPKGVTALDGCKQGAFFGAGKNRTTALTLVFLGDMSSIIIRQNDSSYANIHYVFANPNDKDLNSLTLTVGSANNAYVSNTYMYFCAGNVVYDLGTFKAPNSTVYTVLETDFTKTVNTSEAQPHFADPNKTITTPADCVNNEKKTTYCFCGAEIGATDVENTSLGHTHSIFVDLVYENYLDKGTYKHKCERCDDIKAEKTAPSLFSTLGFSTPEDGRGQLVICFAVNKEAISIYEGLSNKTLTYGAFAVAYDKIGTNDITNADGVIKADIDESYASFEMKITGFETDAHKNAKLSIGAYVIDNKGNISYLQASAPNEGEKYSYITYNGVLAQQ